MLFVLRDKGYLDTVFKKSRPNKNKFQIRLLYYKIKISLFTLIIRRRLRKKTSGKEGDRWFF